MQIANIDHKMLPKHVAIIMDGNGRWAKQRSKDRSEGHREGVETVRRITEEATRLGISYLTLYTFSTENWNRPQQEVDALMELMVYAIAQETPVMMKNNIRLRVIGDISRLPEKTRRTLEECLQKTKNNTALNLVLALSYSSRWEILEATRLLAKKVKEGAISLEQIDEQSFADHLSTHSIPDPDLLIRCGGEQRISNFLLWQISYTEIAFSETLWPDFSEQEFNEILNHFANRERRFGKTSEQIESL